jgi:hypothetical protein
MLPSVRRHGWHDESALRLPSLSVDDAGRLRISSRVDPPRL